MIYEFRIMVYWGRVEIIFIGNIVINTAYYNNMYLQATDWYYT